MIFQMIKRKRYDKLPLQANFYPVASMAYIQDKSSRLSLISGQPLGGTSAASGALEIMLDRRLMQVRVKHSYYSPHPQRESFTFKILQ